MIVLITGALGANRLLPRLLPYRELMFSLWGARPALIMLIITGGQTGADFGAWRAGKAAGIATGDALSAGYLTEDRSRPECAELYVAHQLDSGLYSARTAANVLAADATLWFGYANSRGALATLGAAQLRRKPTKIIPVSGSYTPPSEIVAWLSEHNVKMLTVAGHRESKWPGIGLRVDRVLGRVFTITQRMPSEPEK